MGAEAALKKSSKASSSAISPSFTLLQAGKECTSPDLNLDTTETSKAHHCAMLCWKTKGCQYFAVGTHKNAGRCYWEKTAGPHCPEGWLAGAYNFYRVAPPGAITSRQEHGRPGARKKPKSDADVFGKRR